MLKKMKKVQTKITLAIGLSVAMVSLLIGGISTYVTRHSTLVAVEKTLLETAEVAASDIHRAFMGLHSAIEEAAAASSDRTNAERLAYLKERARSDGFQDALLLDSEGRDIVTGAEYSSESWYTYVHSAGWGISVPIPNADGESMYVLCGIPTTLEDGTKGTALFQIDQQYLQELIAEIKVGESDNTDVYILGEGGVTAASMEYELVLIQENLVESGAVGDVEEEYLGLLEIEREMVAGNSGVMEYSDADGKYIQSFSPIAESGGWSIAITVDYDEFMEIANRGMLAIGGLTVVLVLLSLVIAKFIGKSLGVPIAMSSARMHLLSEGDLHTGIDIVDTEDEVHHLSVSLHNLVNDFNAIIQEISCTLDAVSRGDLTKQSDADKYPGDFRPIYESLEGIIRELNQTIRQIEISSEQVSAGSSQIADSAQQLAQGATEQASSIAELADTIGEISVGTNETADTVVSARKTAGRSVDRVNECNAQMQEMLGVMNEISDNSGKINAIIKIIEDITFQTNILALNAAVEAARAGAAGKGFSVVADEVRNLAAKTAESSKGITPLIMASVESAQKGTKIAADIAKALGEVAELTNESSDMLTRIADAATKQAQDIREVTQGIDQITAVVQTNSAAAEQSAAASEELSAQAEALQFLVERFKLV